MKRSKIIPGIIIVAVVIAIVGMLAWNQNKQNGIDRASESAILSSYVGQESREIKSLSQQDIEGLLTGSGTPFGGMAKPAELNGYPGPRHLLDAVEAGRFEISNNQKSVIEALYDNMRAKAVEVGVQIVRLEEDIDGAFANGNITEDILEELVLKSASLYGQLRLIHLNTHLAMIDILSQEEVAQYNDLRGYTSSDPCENIPEGHDPELWKLHNNCS